MNDVIWLTTNPKFPSKPYAYWDTTLISDILRGKNNHFEVGDLKEAIVVCPTEYQDEEMVNREIAKLDKVIFIATSDECNKFDLSKLRHSNMKAYSTYAHETTADVTWLPIGYTPHSKVKGWLEKDIDIFFAGQVNHELRRSMYNQVSKNLGFKYERTNGFAGGSRENYITDTKRAKVVPAPRGNVSPDSFRLYEALEHGALPVVEGKEFFDKVLPNHPLPIVEDSFHWQIFTKRGVEEFPLPQNIASSYWQRYKEGLYKQFNPEETTVVIPVSPVKSHPDTRILDETIASIRKHLDCRIIITFDGVRPEQEHLRDAYNLFINRVLSSGHDRIYPIIFDKHTHQVGMMREAMKHIDTEFVVYVEQDTPFTEDEIDWEGCKKAITDKQTDLIRFHFEAFIPEPHQYLMMGMLNTKVPLLQTKQYSQRPHITTKAFYAKMLENFTPNANSFIEDKMHSVAQEYPDQYRLSIYHPEGSIKRSTHTDGREGEEKFDGSQVF